MTAQINAHRTNRTLDQRPRRRFYVYSVVGRRRRGILFDLILYSEIFSFYIIFKKD